jgi:hypothetical protein
VVSTGRPAGLDVGQARSRGADAGRLGVYTEFMFMPRVRSCTCSV